MDVWRITLAALRRWYVLLPLLAVTGFAVMSAGNGVAPEYEAQASAMIAPQRTMGDIPNPYGTISTANEALGIVLNGVESRQRVGELGLVTTYEVGTAPRSTILQFTARGPDSEAVVATGNAVFDLAVQELSKRQSDAGLPESQQFSLQILEQPAVVSVVHSGKTRIQAVVGVGGAGLALLVALLFDDIVGLFKRRRPSRTESTGDGGDTDEPPIGSSTPDQAVSKTPSVLVRPPSDGTESMIHTDQWVWPDEHRPVPSERPRRNPYFDPEFTKRSLRKLTATETAANGSPADAADEPPNSADEAARASTATRRP